MNFYRQASEIWEGWEAGRLEGWEVGRIESWEEGDVQKENS